MSQQQQCDGDVDVSRNNHITATNSGIYAGFRGLFAGPAHQALQPYPQTQLFGTDGGENKPPSAIAFHGKKSHFNSDSVDPALLHSSFALRTARISDLY